MARALFYDLDGDTYDDLSGVYVNDVQSLECNATVIAAAVDASMSTGSNLKAAAVASALTDTSMRLRARLKASATTGSTTESPMRLVTTLKASASAYALIDHVHMSQVLALKGHLACNTVALGELERVIGGKRDKSRAPFVRLRMRC